MLDESVTEFDELALVTELRITRVRITSIGAEVHYRVRWQAFHACSDRHVAGETLRVIRSRLAGTHWVFEGGDETLPRNTVDEF